MCAEIESFEIKVPLIFSGTGGFSATRGGTLAFIIGVNALSCLFL